MWLRITKNTDKRQLILYQRNNGSETWMYADDFFVRHDLSHYAIEKIMGYKRAFMGMINDGMDIRDFENREKRLQITITKEACYAENMANLFLIEISQGLFDDFNEVVSSAFVNMSTSFAAPVLLEKEVDSIRKYLRELINDWQKIPAGETMNLTFDI